MILQFGPFMLERVRKPRASGDDPQPSKFWGMASS